MITEEIVENNIKVNNTITDKVSDFAIICERIISVKGFELINMILIDMQSANAFVTVWNAINLHSKKLLQSFLEKGLLVNDLDMVTKVVFNKVWSFAV